MILRRMFDFPNVGFGPRTLFGELERMRRDMDRIFENLSTRTPFQGSLAGVFPLVNLTEDGNNFFLRAELPGIRSSDLEIQATGNSLAISGERKIPEQESGVNFHRRERQAGRFSRVISMPGQIDTGKVEASLADGVLTVIVPKAEAMKPRQINIK